MRPIHQLELIHEKLRACRACAGMRGTPVHGPALATPVMLVGQAPGPHEADRGRPFAHTSGKTLFKWLGSVTGWTEEELRSRIYISAVARCFPGKAASGAGDREPSADEIANCSRHLCREIEVLKPKIILAVGKVAIAQVLGPTAFPKGTPLSAVVGRKVKARFHGHDVTVVALPHPSGVSRWTHTEPGRGCLERALALTGREFKKLFKPEGAGR